MQTQSLATHAPHVPILPFNDETNDQIDLKPDSVIETSCFDYMMITGIYLKNKT